MNATAFSWLDSLTEGDRVIVCGSNRESVRKVTRLTATQVVVGATRFRKDTGREVGAGPWSGSHLREADAESVARIATANRRRALLLTVSRTEWKRLPTETLERVAACLGGEATRP